MVRFYLSPRQDRHGEHPIRVSICIRGIRLVSTVGYSIATDQWNKNEQRVKKGCFNAIKIPGSIINARLKGIDAYFTTYEIALDHQPNLEDLAEHLASVKGTTRRTRKRERRPLTVMECFDKFVIEESRLNQWSDGTLQCWRAFRKHLGNQHFEQFVDINENSIARFVNYLRTIAKLNENTVAKHYSNLMWFLGWCVRKGYCKGENLHKYKPKFKIIAPPVIFLTKNELLKLFNLEIPANGTKVKLHKSNGEEYEKVISDSAALEKTRDLFCFCAFTSLRYSDMAQLKKSDIIDDCIHIVTKKTSDPLIIELNDYSRALLGKYSSKEFPGGLALPVISNQKMNDYIKELGELCEFSTPISRTVFKGGQRIEITQPKWELLGTHAGRRTIICLMLSMGKSPQIIMEWTGHSDYKAMKPYIDVAGETRQKEMRAFDKSMQTES